MNTIEKDKYLNQLSESKKAMLEAIEDVNEETFMHKPSPEKWSISEIIEHVIKVETVIIDQLKILRKKDLKTSLENPMNAEMVFEKSRNRASRATAPRFFVPRGNFKTKERAIAAFLETRQITEDFVKTNTYDLKTITFPHQRFGMFNGENWLAFITGHCARHIEQITEIKE